MTEVQVALTALFHEARVSEEMSNGFATKTWYVGRDRLAIEVDVTQTMLVCVSALETMTSVVETIVDVSKITTRTVAIWVTTRVMVWLVVEVTVTGPLAKCKRLRGYYCCCLLD